jgi:hypothetical protein
VKNEITLSKAGVSFATIHSYYISFSGFSGPSSYECARDFPEHLRARLDLPRASNKSPPPTLEWFMPEIAAR